MYFDDNIDDENKNMNLKIDTPKNEYAIPSSPYQKLEANVSQQQSSLIYKGDRIC